MTYATLTDLIERAGEAEIRQIADRDRDGVADAGVIEAALKGAGDLIDGYIGARYATPLASIPPLVLRWTVSIARYTLHRNGAPKHVRDDYDDAIAALKDVEAKRMALQVPAGEAAPVAATGTIMADHPAPVFTPWKMQGWR